MTKSARNRVLIRTLGLGLFVILIAQTMRRLAMQLKLSESLCDDNCRRSLQRWRSKNTTVEDMMGSTFHAIDLRDSVAFYKQLRKTRNFGFSRALDCASGIGRISKGILLPAFEKVDAVDGVKKFLDIYPSYVGEEFSRKIGMLFLSPLEDLRLDESVYDLIWVQGVLMFLSDEAIVSLLQTLRSALSRDGIIVVKENFAEKTEGLHPEKQARTRLLAKLEELFAMAELRVFDRLQQTDYPEEWYPKMMFALGPEPPEVKSS